MPQPKALNIPNLLTFGRIAAVPAVVACFYFEGNSFRWLAFALFAIAAITDFLDGYLARVWHQQSALGRMLDPIADKLLVSAILLMLASSGQLAGWALWAAIIILCREILVSGLREFLAELNVSVPVTWLAKWKTTAQFVALAILLLGPAGEIIYKDLETVGLTLLWISAVLTLYTGYDYFRMGIHHIIGDDP